MAWRWWAKGGLSPVLRWKTIQCLKGAWKAPLRTQCTCELGPGPEGERLESVASPAPASILGQASLPGLQVPPPQPLARGCRPLLCPFEGAPVLTVPLPSLLFQQPAPEGVSWTSLCS